MAGYKAEFSAPRALAEILADLLAETLDPPPAVSTIEDGPDRWRVALYVDEPLDEKTLDALADGYAQASALRGLEFEPLPDEDWIVLTQRGLHPVEAGRFLVHGSHDRLSAGARASAIEIEAGQAFGTAHHGTTRGCLMMLDSLAKWRPRTRRALDIGTGSGVLAIAIAKTLSRNVLATDIDPIAVNVAKENARLNGAVRYISAMAADGLGDPKIQNRAPFDLVTANILAGPLIDLAPAIRKVMSPGGHLILSGLLESQARQVMTSYHAQDFIIVRELLLEGWSTLHLQRRVHAKKKPS